MEKNKDSKKPVTWFWDLPGSVELSIPSADFKKGEKELLQAVRKAYGDGISDMSLQDVHYNLPIGANRKNMENNMVSLLTEEIDNHPLKFYRTLAEDDKFVIVGDTQSKDIRAYRKLSEEEVVKALVDYAKNNDISIAPMEKELQELVSKIMTKPKAQSKEKTANENIEETKQHRPPQMVTVNGEKVTHAHAFQSSKNPEEWFFTAKLDGQQLRPKVMKPEDAKAYHEHTSSVEHLMQTYYPTKIAKKITPEEFKADNKLSDGRIVERMFVYKEHDEHRADVGKYKLYAQVGDKKMSKTMSHEDLNAFFDRVTTPAKLVEKNFGEQLHLASAYQKYKLPENAGVEKVSIHKNQNGAYVISADMGDKGVTPERKIGYNDLYSYFKSKTVTRTQLAAKYLMDDIRSMHSEKRDVSRGIKIK